MTRRQPHPCDGRLTGYDLNTQHSLFSVTNLPVRIKSTPIHYQHASPLIVKPVDLFALTIKPVYLVFSNNEMSLNDRVIMLG